jgi:hypothetical protein
MGTALKTDRPDGGWVVRPARWPALWVVVLTQWAVVLWAQSWPLSGWLLMGLAGVELVGLSAAYRLIKPNKIIYLRDKSLLVCDGSGRKKAKIDSPQGFASPFFVGIACGRLSHLGLFASQLAPHQYAALLRWVRWR